LNDKGERIVEHTLNTIAREKTGKEIGKKIRMKGYIPAVLYGHKGNKNLSVKASDFDALFEEIGEHSIITLNIDHAEPAEVIVKDFQIDPVKRSVIHVDFFEIERGKVLRTTVPVKTEGVPAGVKKGGVLEIFVRDVEIECLPNDIPDSFSLNVENLEIGDSLHVRDLKAAESVRIISNPEQAILIVGHPTKVAAPTPAPEAAPAEGEVPAAEETKAE
jgi:large subunit ribosomal protein L25